MVFHYEKFLVEEKIIDNSFVKETRDKLRTLIDNEWERSVNEPDVIPDNVRETRDIYYPYKHENIKVSSSKTKKRYVNVITDALTESMNKFPELIIMGQDVADYGGVFKVTEGLVEKFGKERVRNTPLCESAIIGAGLGYSVKGGKAVVEMQFADFISSGFTQIINNVAKIHYRWGQNADLVIRMPTGAGVGAGPFHSQSNEAWFVHTPGLKVVYPSTPFDAKGLLNSAISDPNPVMYFEHKALYRSVSGEVPDDYYTIEIGKANLIKEGDDISVITYGMGVHWATEIVNQLSISADILDLRSLIPWDREAVGESMKKTGKVIILHEDTLTGGIGGEISAWISENCFEYLDAPIFRSASLDTPVPFSTNLEKNFLPKERFKEQLKKLSQY